MRRYTADEEERIRAHARVREWKRSRLLDDGQASSIEAELRTDLRRTNLSLRAVLFIFGSIAAVAAFGFALLVLAVRDEQSAGTLAVTAGVIWFLLAEYLVYQFRLYRFGVEEAFAVWAVVFLAGGVGLLASISEPRLDWPVLVALLTGGAASLGVYIRFGYIYAAVAAVAAAALAPFFVADQSEAVARLLSAAILLAVFLGARYLRRPHEDDFPGDDYGVIESAAWLGMYAVINLRLSFDSGPSGFIDAYYWGSYAATWLLPALGLYLGIRAKHRTLIWVNLVMALATLSTNTLYLGADRHTWDPMLLGVLLIGIALVLRRWLTRGPDGQRHGFTAKRLLAGDREALGTLAMAASATQPLQAHHPAERPSRYEPGGGESGGAGASGKF